MKATTGLLALGLLTLAGVVTVSCGGSSDGDSDNAAGSSSAGKGSGGGSNGGTSSAGTTSKTGGSANSGGTTGTAGTNGNNGGRNNQGGNFPGAGGALSVDECADGVANGEACVPAQGAPTACQLDDTTYCTCQGRNNPTWFCLDSSDIGQGGAGGGGDVTCPANAKNGDSCTGIGVCPGSTTCGCVLGTIYCGGPQQ